MKEKYFKFNIFTFILGACIGIFYIIYIDESKQKEIIKYPTPYNTKRTVYKGFSGDCYKFNVRQVQCTKDAIEQPII